MPRKAPPAPYISWRARLRPWATTRREADSGSAEETQGRREDREGRAEGEREKAGREAMVVRKEKCARGRLRGRLE